MPFAALAGPLIGLGSSLVGGILGSKKSKAQDQNNLALTQAIQSQQKMSQGLIDQGTPLVSQGAGSLSDLISNYYGPLAYGNAAASNRVLANPISDMRQGLASSINRMGQTGARSGGMGSLLGQANINQGSQIAGMRFGAQNDAAANIGNIGRSLLGAGAGLETGGADSMRGAISGLLGQGQQLGQQQNQANAAWGSAGKGFGDSLLGLIKAIGNRSRGGGG